MLRGDRLAILIRVLMLLACGPLLLPSGYCICTIGIATATPLESHPTLCCSHHDHTSPDHDNAGSDSAPMPDDDEHAPGCPAITGEVSCLPPAESNIDVTVLAVVPAASNHSDRSLISLRLDPPPSEPFRLSSPPLYLAHCSLVI